jgi:hypothetical protein
LGQVPLCGLQKGANHTNNQVADKAEAGPFNQRWSCACKPSGRSSSAKGTVTEHRKKGGQLRVFLPLKAQVKTRLNIELLQHHPYRLEECGAMFRARVPWILDKRFGRVKIAEAPGS